LIAASLSSSLVEQVHELLCDEPAIKEKKEGVYLIALRLNFAHFGQRERPLKAPCNAVSTFVAFYCFCFFDADLSEQDACLLEQAMTELLPQKCIMFM
jgi:hypothetical protein